LPDLVASARRLASGGALLAALLAAPAAAQIPTSTQDRVTTPVPPSLEEVARTDAVFRDAVACVVRYQPGRTRNLLDTIPGTDAEHTILASFQSRLNQCYDYHRNQGRSMSFSLNLLRGAIAEIYFRREFPDGLIPAADAPPELAAAWVRPRSRDGSTTQSEMLHAMARCVAVRRPGGVGAMIAAEPFTPRELDAIRGMQEDLSACLDAGVAFEASRQALRGLLAEAALHYAEARRDGFARVGRSEPSPE